MLIGSLISFLIAFGKRGSLLRSNA